jgi:hypothetical protein
MALGLGANVGKRRGYLASALIPTLPRRPNTSLVILNLFQDNEEWENHPKSSLSIYDGEVAAGTADGGACNSEAAPKFPSRRRVEGTVPRTDPRGSTGLRAGPHP